MEGDDQCDPSDGLPTCACQCDEGNTLVHKTGRAALLPFRVGVVGRADMMTI